jgi:hypothetical protein
LLRRTAGFVGNACRHAISSAAFNSATVTFASVTVVDPCCPHAFRSERLRHDQALQRLLVRRELEIGCEPIRRQRGVDALHAESAAVEMGRLAGAIEGKREAPEIARGRHVRRRALW